MYIFMCIDWMALFHDSTHIFNKKENKRCPDFSNGRSIIDQ